MTKNTAETLRNKAFDAVQLALGDAYDCGREWSAWSWGNMSEEDFSPVYENPNRVSEIANAALDAVGFDALIGELAALRIERDDLIEALRKVVCKLPRYSFLSPPEGSVRRVQDRSGRWIEFDAVHELLDPAVIDAIAAGKHRWQRADEGG